MENGSSSVAECSIKKSSVSGMTMYLCIAMPC